MEVVYEDNHIIIVNKQSGEIVQGDKTGDRPLSDIVPGPCSSGWCIVWIVLSQDSLSSHVPLKHSPA